ncbi:hypothetical protein SH449x_003307 [Pirellulaceae bacterium SH449]
MSWSLPKTVRFLTTLGCFATGFVFSSPHYSMACDPPQTTRQVTVLSVVATAKPQPTTQAPCVDTATTQRIVAIEVRLNEHVEFCDFEAAQAEQALHTAALKVLEIRALQDTSVSRMVILNNLLDGCSSHTQLGNFRIKKEEIAKVLEHQIGVYEELLVLEKGALESLVAARSEHKRLLERLAKWQAQQKELAAKVSALQVDQASRREKQGEVLTEQAIREAIGFVAGLESQFQKIEHKVAKASATEAPKPSAGASEVGESIASVLAEVDALLPAPTESPSR